MRLSFSHHDHEETLWDDTEKGWGLLSQRRQLIKGGWWPAVDEDSTIGREMLCMQVHAPASKGMHVCEHGVQAFDAYVLPRRTACRPEQVDGGATGW